MLTVLRHPVDDDFRLFFWGLPQFAPWRQKLLSRNRKDPLAQAALSVLLDFLLKGSPCSRHKGRRWDLARKLAAAAGCAYGVEAVALLNGAFKEVGLALSYTDHSYEQHLARAYKLEGIPQALLDRVDREGLEPRERTARLDNASGAPSRTPARRARQKKQQAVRAALERNIAEVAAWNPDRAERMAFYRDATCAHQEAIAERRGLLLTRAKLLRCDASVLAAVHEACALGLPRPLASAGSSSARIGGTLGRFPSGLQPFFVPGFVSLDLRSAAPTVAGFLFGSDETRAYLAECMDADCSPAARIASETLEACGVPLSEQLEVPHVLEAAQKAAKRWWITGLNGGSDFSWPVGPLEARGRNGGERRLVPGFYDALRQHAVVRDTIEATWGADGNGGAAGELARTGRCSARGHSLRVDHDPHDDWKVCRKRAGRALSDTYNHYEWVALRAALRVVQRSKNFEVLGDSNDGFSVRRRDLEELGLGELERASEAARKALREVGLDGRLRVKYDAQRGGELVDEGTLRFLRARLAAQPRPIASAA